MPFLMLSEGFWKQNKKHGLFKTVFVPHTFFHDINQSVNQAFIAGSMAHKNTQKTKKKGTHINDINVFACLFLNIHNTV